MIFVILPAFNEEKSLPCLLPKLKNMISNMKEEVQIIVCDDGSSDNTRQILEQNKNTLPLILISHKINRGLGETMRDLYEYVALIANDEDIIIRMDCDDTHEPEYIPKIIESVKNGYDVVIASRFQPGGGQRGLNKYRTFISSCANVFMRLFFSIPSLKEYSCGFRGYRASIIKKAIQFYGNDFIQLKGLGFTCTLEKLVKLKILGAKFGEVPFILRYNQKQSTSKMVSSITTYGYVTLVVMYHWPFGGWKRKYSNKILKNQ